MAGSLQLRGGLCIFIPALLGPEASPGDVEHYGKLARAVRQTWLTNSTTFVLPEEGSEAPGLLGKLAGLQTTRLSPTEGLRLGRSLRALYFWRHIVSLLEEGGGSGRCDWVMKIPVSSYVNTPTLQSRLDCFDASDSFFLGVPTVAYSAGEAPFMFPNPLGGTIISRGLLEHVFAWTDYCMRYAETTDTPYGSDSFFDEYTFSMCMSDLGHLVASNYADMEGSFILYDRPNHTVMKFRSHPDTLKQCLLVVGKLDNGGQILHVHDRIAWSKWHTSIPCIGESQMGKFSISDAYGNAKEYYEERIRLALYYCKALAFSVLGSPYSRHPSSGNEMRWALQTIVALLHSPRNYTNLFRDFREPKGSGVRPPGEVFGGATAWPGPPCGAAGPGRQLLQGVSILFSDDSLLDLLKLLARSCHACSEQLTD